MSYAKILTVHKENDQEPFLIIKYADYFQDEKGLHIQTECGNNISINNFSEITDYIAENKEEHDSFVRSMKMVNVHLDPV